jgi:hypothetical protein
LVTIEIERVDKTIAELNLHLKAGFQANQAGAQKNALPKGRTIQPYRRLNLLLQDTEQSYEKFLEAVQLYFAIHYVDMPAKDWDELLRVKKVSDNIQHQMANQTRSKFQTQRYLSMET